LLFDPKLISAFINKLDGLEKISVGINLMEPSVFDTEDDDWIKDGLKNPNWITSDFDPTQSEDIEDIKLIKQSISPKIKFDFIHLGTKDLDILKKNLIIE
jgi:hypothetical protein